MAISWFFFLIYITDWFWLETNEEIVERSQIPDTVSMKVDSLGAHFLHWNQDLSGIKEINYWEH